MLCNIHAKIVWNKENTPLKAWQFAKHASTLLAMLLSATLIATAVAYTSFGVRLRPSGGGEGAGERR
jgi:ABC-type uncharacterized transport system permease subunit